MLQIFTYKEIATANMVLCLAGTTIYPSKGIFDMKGIKPFDKTSRFVLLMVIIIVMTIMGILMICKSTEVRDEKILEEHPARDHYLGALPSSLLLQNQLLEKRA